jgi:hypothetical protein
MTMLLEYLPVLYLVTAFLICWLADRWGRNALVFLSLALILTPVVGALTLFFLGPGGDAWRELTLECSDEVCRYCGERLPVDAFNRPSVEAESGGVVRRQERGTMEAMVPSHMGYYCPRCRNPLEPPHWGARRFEDQA